MRTRWLPLVTSALLFTVGSSSQASPQQLPEYGPARGALVIVGGGQLEGTGIIESFIELAGGPAAKVIIVPTARGNRNPDGTIRVYKEETVVAPWLKRGLTNLKMLHTSDPKVADAEPFVRDLREATGVWFDGGRQWNIVDSYMNTLTSGNYLRTAWHICCGVTRRLAVQ